MTATLEIHDPVLHEFADAVGVDAPIAIEGGRTRWGLGGDLVDSTPLLRAPSGIVEYVPEEMIVKVRAGTNVADLHAALAEHGQWTALPERGGTVGGAVAVGQNDHRKGARGDVRSSILQVRYVSAEGRLVSGGGPTVKNVSGFDLPRLLTGSLGTLGCIAEVIVRTNPVPAVIRWFRSENADPFEIHAALLQPGAILWDGSTTDVMLYGHGVDVEADRAVLTSLATFDEIDEPIAPTGHRWSLRPSDLSRVENFDTGDFIAEIGVGLIHAASPQVLTPIDDGVRVVHERLKVAFDPTGRLNPGRVVGTR